MLENSVTKYAGKYPENGITNRADLDVISPDDASTLDAVFQERVRRSANKIAYTEFDAGFDDWLNYSWIDIATQVNRWIAAFQDAGLVKGDRVAIRLKNGINWVICDQAALRLGLVVVPLYCDDRADNVNYVLHNSGAKFLLLNNEQEWVDIRDADGEDVKQLRSLKNVVVLTGIVSEKKVTLLSEWLPEEGVHLESSMAESGDLASIVYTSGTTGKPKGVMLSHNNMLQNSYAGMQSVPLMLEDRMLSFLPLSHTFERTIGYYAAMQCGVHAYFNRSIPDLVDDLLVAKPTALIAVPRIFERVNNKVYKGVSESSDFKQKLFHAAIDFGWHRFEYSQGRAKWHPKLLVQPILDVLVGKKVREKLGGNLRFAVVGGAPMSPAVAKTFIGLGIKILQGYGLTESSPVVSVNTLEKNKPDSIGLPLNGVEVAIGEDSELLIRGENVMQGYWKNAKATKATIDKEGWLHSGDQASIDDEGFIRIIGRIKDILVLANGEKMPPADMESAIQKDELFEQAMVVGEGKPFLSALIVLNADAWKQLKTEKGLSDEDLNSDNVHEVALGKVATQVDGFPGYAKIRKVHLMLEEWVVEDGLITPTLKVKRPKVLAKYSEQVKAMYDGHGVSTS